MSAVSLNDTLSCISSCCWWRRFDGLHVGARRRSTGTARVSTYRNSRYSQR